MGDIFRTDLVEKTLEEKKKRERIERLARIFVPHAQRLRDKFFKNENNVDAPSRKFVHYTSADAALKIITNKCLWMRSTTCMSDYREVHHGYTIFQKFFYDADNTKSFIEAINAFVPGAAEQAIKLFDQWWNSIQYDTFITSISEHSDSENQNGRLSMWRAFGGNAARVAIVINVPSQSTGAESMNLRFCPVAYLTETEQKKLVPDVIENLGKNADYLKSIPELDMVDWIFRMFLLGVTSIKHEGFCEEKEWRVIHFPFIDKASKLIKCTETIAGIPQLIYKLPLDKKIDPAIEDIDLCNIFDRLIIGPSQFPSAMAAAFIDALTNIGVPEAHNKISTSGIPIRS